MSYVMMCSDRIDISVLTDSQEMCVASHSVIGVLHILHTIPLHLIHLPLCQKNKKATKL